MLKRIITLIIALTMTVGVLSTNTFATQKDLSGKCGENLSWKLDKKGVLTISGKGKMIDYDYPTDSMAPWYSYYKNIKKVVIKPGVTSIGSFAFFWCINMTDVTIPASVKKVKQ